MMIQYKELCPDLWPAFEELFGEKGACAGCWCTWWRIERGGRLWEETKGKKAKAMMRKLVKNGKALGILAFDGDSPVGWCSFGPRADFPHLDRVKAYIRNDTDNVWCINCFFIDRGYRNMDISRGLLKAAIKAMRKRKVITIEAYPITTTLDGRRISPTFSYTGPIKIFEEAGFREIQRLAPTKPLIRLQARG